MDHLYPDMLAGEHNRDDITRWWEVIDRTTGELVSGRVSGHMMKKPEMW